MTPFLAFDAARPAFGALLSLPRATGAAVQNGARTVAGALGRWVLCLAGAVACGAAMPAERTPVPSFAPALRVALPSVVGVYGMADDVEDSAGLFDEPPMRRGGERAPWSTNDMPTRVGAGFFIDDRGTLVTAAHVVADTRRVMVKLADQQIRVAVRVGSDSEADIAVLRVQDPPAISPRLGRSGASRPGDWVLAVGEPYGLRRSVIAGIVAGPARHFAEDSEGYFIQTNLALNPGNSGGPLLDTEGAVIGMNLRTVVGPYGTSGVSLSIPIEVVLQIADELARGSGRLRPRLGAGFEDVSVFTASDAGRSSAGGAMVSEVAAGSHADRLGLRRGDIVTGMNGFAIDDSADLARALLRWNRVETTRMVVWRNGAYRELRWP